MCVALVVFKVFERITLVYRKVAYFFEKKHLQVFHPRQTVLFGETLSKFNSWNPKMMGFSQGISYKVAHLPIYKAIYKAIYRGYKWL